MTTDMTTLVISSLQDEVKSLKMMLNIYMETNEKLINEITKLRCSDKSGSIMKQMKRESQDYRRFFEFDLSYSLNNMPKTELQGYGKESVRITDELYIRYLTEGSDVIVKLIAYIHRNYHLPQYHNIYVKDDVIYRYNGHKWVTEDIEEIHYIIQHYDAMINRKKIPRELVRKIDTVSVCLRDPELIKRVIEVLSI